MMTGADTYLVAITCTDGSFATTPERACTLAEARRLACQISRQWNHPVRIGTLSWFAIVTPDDEVEPVL